jgi:hypothetical protein
MSSDEAPFSELVNKPVATIDRLARARSLLLKRRNEEDLVLTTATRARQDSEVVEATLRLFAALLRHKVAPDVLAEVLLDAFPWVRYLPAGDAPMFVAELVDTLRAIEDLDTPHQWSSCSTNDGTPPRYTPTQSLQRSSPEVRPATTAPCAGR